MKLCRQIALHGQYNPTRRPDDDRFRSRPGDRQGDNRTDDQRPVVGIGTGVNHGAGVGSQHYTPPEFGRWNADQFGSAGCKGL